MNLITTLRRLVHTTAILTLLLSGPVKAQLLSPPNRQLTNYPVNIKTFGAVGDGNTDDTAAIQAAIDYAYTHSVQGIFCPSGNYKTTRTIYLDAPGNLRSNFANPSIFNFSLAFIGQDDGMGNIEGFGCRLQPNFNDAVAFIVGPGQRMKVSGIAVVGPNTGAYRGNLPPTGIGMGIAGGNGGASDTLIENTDVENFYTLYETGANGNPSLADSNSFRHVNGRNGFYGIVFSQTQNDINDVLESRFTATIDFWNKLSRQVTVVGGNYSAISSASNAFGISGTSSFTKTADGGGFDYSFNTVIASPDGYIPNVYNSFTLVTPHFGLVPVAMTNWNPATSTATFQIYPPWVFANFGNADLTILTDIQVEVAAATTLYAAERVTIVQGQGVSMQGIHVENPNACTTFLDLQASFLGASVSKITAPFFNYDPALTNFSPVHSPSPGNLALFYCQQAFPFISAAGPSGNNARVIMEGGDFGQNDPLSAPLTIEQLPYRIITARALNSIAPMNMRVGDNGGSAFGEPGTGAQYHMENQANGAGEWDGNYFVPRGWQSAPNNSPQIITHGPLTVPYYGYRPAPGVRPNLAPDLYLLVSGALGRLGTYPPIDCQTIYQSVNWNSQALRHIHLRSASCPGYSWGQNLTDALVGEPVMWSYKGNSAMLYLDEKTLSWMFPGMGFTLPGSFNNDPYIVTGVYPQLGYVTVVDVATYHGAPMRGDKLTVYSCSSGCSIGQAPYAWTQY